MAHGCPDVSVVEMRVAWRAGSTLSDVCEDLVFHCAGCEEVGPHHRRSEEATSLQARNRRSSVSTLPTSRSGSRSIVEVRCIVSAALDFS